MQKAKENHQKIQEKVERTYIDTKNLVDNSSIIKVNDKVLSLDPGKSQKEIYNGRFTLSFSSKMPLK